MTEALFKELDRLVAYAEKQFALKFLAVSLDANEQFCSDHRCCEDCLTREITCKDAQGNEVKKRQYYHKQVYAQLSAPRLSVILDWELRKRIYRSLLCGWPIRCFSG